MDQAWSQRTHFRPHPHLGTSSHTQSHLWTIIGCLFLSFTDHFAIPAVAWLSMAYCPRRSQALPRSSLPNKADSVSRFSDRLRSPHLHVCATESHFPAPWGLLSHSATLSKVDEVRALIVNLENTQPIERQTRSQPADASSLGPLMSMSDAKNCTVGWIRDIGAKHLAAQLCLDEEHAKLQQRLSPQDTNTYPLNKVARHAALPCYPSLAELPGGK